MLKKTSPWLLPILFMVLITPFTFFLDLYVSHLFYSREERGIGHFTSNPVFSFLYDYGPWITATAVTVASLIYLLSFLIKSWKKWRPFVLYFCLVYIIGAGVIVHGLKETWGRPRPVQTTEFGGTQEFRPFYSPHFSNSTISKAFPCGHCSIGFFFFAFYFLGKRLDNSLLKWAGLAFALFFGISLSVMRIGLGGHFLSDTLMSALLMWLTAYALDWLLFSEENA